MQTLGALDDVSSVYRLQCGSVNMLQSHNDEQSVVAEKVIKGRYTLVEERERERDELFLFRSPLDTQELPHHHQWRWECFVLLSSITIGPLVMERLVLQILTRTAEKENSAGGFYLSGLSLSLFLSLNVCRFSRSCHSFVSLQQFSSPNQMKNDRLPSSSVLKMDSRSRRAKIRRGKRGSPGGSTSILIILIILQSCVSCDAIISQFELSHVIIPFHTSFSLLIRSSQKGFGFPVILSGERILLLQLETWCGAADDVYLSCHIF